MQTYPRAAVAALLAATVASCGTPDQIIVRNETDPYNLAAAQVAADQQCAARGGGKAQFVVLLNNPPTPGAGQSGGSWIPDIVYRCPPR